MATHVGGYAFEKVSEEGKEYYKATLESGTEVAIQAGSGAVSVIKRSMDSGDKIGEELKDFSENMAKLGLEGFGDVMHTTADTVENWRKGWENFAGKITDNTTNVLKDGIGVAKAVVETKAEIKLGALKIEVGDKKGDINEAKVEGKDEIIKNLKEELIKKDQALEKKDERIKELEQAQAGQQKSQEALFDKALNAVVEVAGKSAGNSRVASRASTPPPYTKEPQ